MRSKALKQFIRENRAEIDAAILALMFRHDGKGGRGTIPDPPPRINDKERRLWILNDEGLYRTARSAGVRV
jgi:hypothetical protein